MGQHFPPLVQGQAPAGYPSCESAGSPVSAFSPKSRYVACTRRCNRSAGVNGNFRWARSCTSARSRNRWGGAHSGGQFQLDQLLQRHHPGSLPLRQGDQHHCVSLRLMPIVARSKKAVNLTHASGPDALIELPEETFKQNGGNSVLPVPPWLICRRCSTFSMAQKSVLAFSAAEGIPAQRSRCMSTRSPRKWRKREA